MDSIEIQLVRVGGFLVGRRFQDRWNLDMMGIQSIPYDRNQAMLKKLRRFGPSEGFSYRTVKGGMVGMDAADLELMRRPAKMRLAA